MTDELRIDLASYMPPGIDVGDLTPEAIDFLTRQATAYATALVIDLLDPPSTANRWYASSDASRNTIVEVFVRHGEKGIHHVIDIKGQVPFAPLMAHFRG